MTPQLTHPEHRKSTELDRGEWAAFFDKLNRLAESGVDLEAALELVTDKTVGTEAERLPLNGITYEDGDDQNRGRRWCGQLYPSLRSAMRAWGGS